LINEVHADPHPESGDANDDGQIHSDDDEFLELVNPDLEMIDLSGWELRDEIKTRFVFPDETILKGGCGLVVFGGLVDYSEISGSLVFGTGSLGLNNGGDVLYLVDLNGEIQTSLSYGPEGGQDQSLARFPDLVGELPLVFHTEIPEAEGRLFSPGTWVEGSAFGECPWEGN
jgi:hypothetical protein